MLVWILFNKMVYSTKTLQVTILYTVSLKCNLDSFSKKIY